MLSHAFCQVDLFRDERHEGCRSAVPPTNLMIAQNLREL
jgi:hypothetical protein